MSTEGERISEIISSFCKSKADFARKIGEKPQTVSNWVSRGAGKNVLNKIMEAFPEINTNWLLMGEGEMLKRSEPYLPDATVIRTQGNDVYLETSSGIKYFELSGNKYRMRVPLVPFNAYARYASEACSTIEQDREEWDEVEFIVDKIGHGNYMAFEIKGDSMDDDSRRSFVHGDLVLARELDKIHWTSSLHYNQYPYWIIVLSNTILCKEIIDHNVDTGIITCHSLNPSPEYTDFTVNLNDVCRIFNIVQKTSITF